MNLLFEIDSQIFDGAGKFNGGNAQFEIFVVKAVAKGDRERVMSVSFPWQPPVSLKPTCSWGEKRSPPRRGGNIGEKREWEILRDCTLRGDQPPNLCP